MQTKDDLCSADFNRLSISDAISGDRLYQISDKEEGHWQEYYIESTLAGFEDFDLSECEDRLALAFDY